MNRRIVAFRQRESVYEIVDTPEKPHRTCRGTLVASLAVANLFHTARKGFHA